MTLKDEMYRWIAEAVPDGVWTVDPQGRTIFSNRRMAEIIAADPESMAERTCFDCLYPEDLDDARRRFAESLAGDRRPFDFRLCRTDGSPVWVSISCMMVCDDSGTPVGLLGLFTDITERRRRQEADLARQKAEVVAALAAGVAHDFNNLLCGILAQVDLASAELSDGRSPAEELESIRLVATRGSELVRQLMIYAGQECQSTELVDVGRLVSETAELLKLIVTKQAVLEVDIGEDVGAVHANPAELRQVLMNLVLNASEATVQPNSLIRLAASRVALKGASVPDGNYIRVEVSDQGCGMTAETKSRIFDPFFTTKGEGRGLGLSVVQGVVRGLGGEIELLSEPERGTKFHILLPRAADQYRQAAP